MASFAEDIGSLHGDPILQVVFTRAVAEHYYDSHSQEAMEAEGISPDFSNPSKVSMSTNPDRGLRLRT
jgi:hypothetical protein